MPTDEIQMFHNDDPTSIPFILSKYGLGAAKRGRTYLIEKDGQFAKLPVACDIAVYTTAKKAFGIEIPELNNR